MRRRAAFLVAVTVIAGTIASCDGTQVVRVEWNTCLLVDSAANTKTIVPCPTDTITAVRRAP